METFWFRDISNTRDIRTYVLNIFKYIYCYKRTKLRKKNFGLFTKIFEL